MRKGIEKRIDDRRERLVRVEGDVAAHDRARLVLHRLNDVGGEGIDGDERGNSEGDRRHVEQKSPARGTALAPGQAPQTSRRAAQVDEPDVAPVSSTIAPSNSLMMREAFDASSCSWVTRTIVE